MKRKKPVKPQTKIRRLQRDLKTLSRLSTMEITNLRSNVEAFRKVLRDHEFESCTPEALDIWVNDIARRTTLLKKRFDKEYNARVLAEKKLNAAIKIGTVVCFRTSNVANTMGRHRERILGAKTPSEMFSAITDIASDLTSVTTADPKRPYAPPILPDFLEKVEEAFAKIEEQAAADQTPPPTAKPPAAPADAGAGVRERVAASSLP